MTRALALIGIVALLLYFRIPQRIDWNELRGFKGADSVEKAADPLLEGLKGDKPLPGNKPSITDAGWMQDGCQRRTVASGTRLTKADYNRHLSSRDLNADNPLQNGTVKPFCLHRDGAKVFIPDWLTERRYRLKITPGGEDVVEQMSGGQGT